MAENEFERFIKLAVIFSIVAAVFVAAVLIYSGRPEPYSAVFILPNSYQNYIGNSSSISFTWGIQSFEQGPSKYKYEVFLGNVSLKQKELIIPPGQYTANETLALPDNVSFPEQVRVNINVNGRAYDAHYWIKGRD